MLFTSNFQQNLKSVKRKKKYINEIIRFAVSTMAEVLQIKWCMIS